MSWQSLRAQTRLLEHQTEQAITQATPSKQQIQDLLSQRQTILDALADLLQSDPSPGSRPLHLERHREVLAEHSKESTRILDRKKEAEDRENLLGTVSEDIRKFKGNAADEQGYMLAERDRIENSHGIADSVLAQAYATRDDFRVQSVNLQNIGQRIAASSRKVPGMSQLLGKINTRQKRNSLILAIVISLGVLFLLFS